MRPSRETLMMNFDQAIHDDMTKLDRRKLSREPDICFGYYDDPMGQTFQK